MSTIMSGARRRGGRARAMVAGLGLATAMLGCSDPTLQPPAPAARALPRPPPPQLAAVTQARPSYVGVVIARQAVDLSAEVPGTLVELDAALGERVEVGAVLARVRAPMLPAEIEAAEAALAEAEAALAEQELLVVAARRRLGQEQRLASAGASASEDLERAQLELDQAAAAARRVAAQQAERRAALRRLHAQRDAGVMSAPFSGTIATWYQPEGAVVSTGERLVRLVDVERLWVRFAVPVDELGEIRPGVVVEVVPLPEAPRLLATVRHVAPELDLASQRMLVEAELHDAPAIKAGQACHVVRRRDPSVAAEPESSLAIVVSSTDHSGGT